MRRGMRQLFGGEGLGGRRYTAGLNLGMMSKSALRAGA
jgi:hypothetical protein